MLNTSPQRLPTLHTACCIRPDVFLGSTKTELDAQASTPRVSGCTRHIQTNIVIHRPEEPPQTYRHLHAVARPPNLWVFVSEKAVTRANPEGMAVPGRGSNVANPPIHWHPAAESVLYLFIRQEGRGQGETVGIDKRPSTRTSQEDLGRGSAGGGAVRCSAMVERPEGIVREVLEAHQQTEKSHN